MTNVKRYYSFLLGIIAASVTWSVVLYVYVKLGTDLHTNLFYVRDPVFSNKSKESINAEKLQNYRSISDVVLPYENNGKGLFYQKQKYFQNSKNLIQQLQPKVVSGEIDKELGVVKTIADQRKKDEGYKNFAFNVLVSDGIGMHRNVPDTRHQLCKKEKYKEDLPEASIVICFYNEHFTTLLRSVHSILDRTPASLLHEVILVNDFSDLEGLHQNVSDYISGHLTTKVRLYKTRKRQGLIRARMFGARKATGKVLVFLDSHIEVNTDWLQPLLSRIAESRKNVVMPIIDIINSETFKYTSSPLVRGGFNWGLHFKWENLPKDTLKTDEDFIKPVPSPTMAGGLFAMDREYFVELGEYDPGMNIWGGENLEISFRIWMCGGNLELVPCSRVGHVFRKRRPYGSPTGEDTMTRNSLRVANVWLDDYKDYFYKQRPEARNVQYGDLTDRIKLRERLQCHDFDWYLKNIYPELILPTDNEQRLKKKWSALEQQKYQPWHSRKRNYLSQFQIRLSNTSLCVASEKDVKTKGSLLILKPCLRTRSQIWGETDKKELVLATLLCLDAAETYPKLAKCHEMGEGQEWYHKFEKQTSLFNMAAGTCLGVRKSTSQALVTMELCSKKDGIKWDLMDTT